MTCIRETLILVSVPLMVLATSPAFAASDFDGTWVVDVPAAGQLNGSSESVCPALRFPIEIKDGHVGGTLTRVPSRTGDVIVEAGKGPVSAPVTGTVQPDGSVTAEWLNYHAEGRLAAKDGVATIKGECGPRQATLVRVQ
jgi:hypothetical protein